jgi:hypothetical protein
VIDWTPVLVPARGTFAQRAGIYYERQVAAYFDQQYLCAIQPTIYTHKGKRRPDLLIFDEAFVRCIIVEVKYSFVPSAFVQLAHYQMLLRRELPWMELSTLVVCQNYQPEPGVTLVGKTELWKRGPTASAVLVLSGRELRLGRYGRKWGREPAEASFRQPWSVGNSLRDRGELPGVAAKARAGQTPIDEGHSR